MTFESVEDAMGLCRIAHHGGFGDLEAVMGGVEAGAGEDVDDEWLELVVL